MRERPDFSWEPSDIASNCSAPSRSPFLRRTSLAFMEGRQSVARALETTLRSLSRSAIPAAASSSMSMTRTLELTDPFIPSISEATAETPPLGKVCASSIFHA